MITFTTMSLPHSFLLLFLLLFILFLGVWTPKFIDLLLSPLPHSSSSYSSSSPVVVVVEFVRIGIIWSEWTKTKEKKKQPDVYLTVILLLVNWYDQIHTRLNLENGSTSLSWSQKSISESWRRSRRTLCGINDFFTCEPTYGSLYEVICGSLCVPICDSLIWTPYVPTLTRSLRLHLFLTVIMFTVGFNLSKMQGNKMFESSGNTRKQGVWICRKIQGNKVCQYAEIFKETMCLNLMENERKQDVSICRKI